eukprot:GHVS01101381.1.p1 GENE.GHVS01101381.1~~GHVS01101381.1.p1  ORF type:complete len:299 (+),score=50.22 GHVS01101381.1:78-974(+)
MTVESTEGGRMAERREEKNRRRIRKSPRWLLFAVMGLTALGCVLSFWGHPPSLLQLGLPAVAAAAPVLGLLSGGTERKLGGSELIRVVVDRGETCEDGTKFWENTMGDGFETMLTKDRQSLTATFGVNGHMVAAKTELSAEPPSFASGGVSYYIKFMDMADDQAWAAVGKEARLIVATDKDETVAVAMQRAVEALNWQAVNKVHGNRKDCVFNPIPLTEKGTALSHKNLWTEKLMDMFAIENNRLTLNLNYWVGYVEARIGLYNSLVLAIDYEKDGGQILNDNVVELTETKVKELETE